MIIKDHPFGIGPNHYVVVANTQGYSQRAGVVWASGSRATSVHNSYLLIQAESGYLGLFAIIAFLGTSVIVSFRAAFRNRNHPMAQLLIGVVGGLVAVTLHALYEWMLVTHQFQYMLAVTLGLAAGLIRQLSTDRASRRVPSAPVEKAFVPAVADPSAIRPSPQ